ncbi:FAD:protein FMN transferase [Microbacterium sp. E-13]|uniref:FAD:protein FMN transferase n=1 Tax=Microbacterium sp. E-13 TaxID=3404048 RepID=UPI003CF20429
MRATFETMGTVASIALDRPASLEPVRAIFDHYDEVFSLYRPDSPMSAMARAQLTLAVAPVIVRDEYARAVEWRAATHGWFTPHRPDGTIDLSGTIKAVAMQRAVDELARRNHSGLLGVGGDIAVVGQPAAAPCIGIIDPQDRTRLLFSVELTTRRAIATSGLSERGDHIWRPLGESDVIQATVIAEDILTADVLATALVAAGSAHVDELTEASDVDVLLVLQDQTLLATPGFAALARHPAAEAAAIS